MKGFLMKFIPFLMTITGVLWGNGTINALTVANNLSNMPVHLTATLKCPYECTLSTGQPCEPYSSTHMVVAGETATLPSRRCSQSKSNLKYHIDFSRIENLDPNGALSISFDVDQTQPAQVPTTTVSPAASQAPKTSQPPTDAGGGETLYFW